MDLSIIIVNYNVKHFLRQCLSSVYASSIAKDRYEVLVVDNASVDDSVEMVKTDFPQATIMTNIENLGFSKANNQAIAVARGTYVLLLNPDTILREDTLELCLQYMSSDSEIGALGVRMIDGSGTFLPESKRGLPTVWNSFCKLTGLNSLLPSVKLFSGYTLSHLDEHATADVDVLCGAFMMMPNAVLGSVGLLDERFFMYAEDIDLSYRIKTAGYRVVYFADTEIIHYKGESSKKGSLGYVKMFYEAMILYVQKHYQGVYGRLFVLALKTAIIAKGALTLGKYTLGQVLQPVIDLLVIVVIGGVAKGVWASYRYADSNYYDKSPIWLNIVLTALILVVGIWISMGYRRQASTRRQMTGLLMGTIVALAVYGMLDTDYRSSRAVVIIMGLVATIVIPLLHMITSKYLRHNGVKTVLIIGDSFHASRITQVMKAQQDVLLVGVIHPSAKTKGAAYINTIDSLSEVIRVMKVNEIIFSRPDLDMTTIMQIMQQTGTQISYKISGDDLLAMVGSGSKNHQGQIYTVDISFRLGQNDHLQTKYRMDKVLCLVALVAAPVAWPLHRWRSDYWRAVASVWAGDMTWVGYPQDGQLPALRDHVINIEGGDLSSLEYAKSHRLSYDITGFINYLLRL